METIQLLIKKLRIVLPIIVTVSAVVFFYKIITTPKTSARADEYGVTAKITGKQTGVGQDKSWTWDVTVTAEKHIGEAIPVQIGVYHCALASTDACRPDSADFSETISFQSHNFPVRTTSFETTHTGVDCGRVQIVMRTNGINLGEAVQNTNITCPGYQSTTAFLADQPAKYTDTTENWETFGGMRAITCLATGSGCPDDYLDPVIPYPGDPELTTPDPTSSPGSGAPAPTNEPTRLGDSIPFRTTTINPGDGAEDYVACVWKKSDTRGPMMDYWQLIIDQSISKGWNPTFVLALWNEETGASSYSYDAFDGHKIGGSCPATNRCAKGHLGCRPKEPQSIDGRDSLPSSLACLFDNFSQYPNDDFAGFMQRYSGETQPGIFTNNPNFPRNLDKWYKCLANFQKGGANPDCPQVKRCL